MLKELSALKMTTLNIVEFAQHFKVEMEKIVAKLPQYEKYNLIDQAIRASESIYSNKKDYEKLTTLQAFDHLNISLGSCAECMAIIDSCYSLSYITIEEFDTLNGIAESIYKELVHVLNRMKREETDYACC
ncbi:four helix bundle protein [Alkalihalobacterium bogoriense]|uniref:four helix bundle protein n=1 Tax=Alkalihalobacterium bogoriense TaxID=246272 RepID=UPI00047EC7FD|nr:four helix bundle protein [Alkalihalobacterium bogoriense]